MIGETLYGNPMHQLLELFNNYDQILNRNFSVKDLKVPYRNINHWDEKGLLLNTKREDGQWRKFNFMDCIWIRIVTELRKFGASFALIITLKEILTEKIPFQKSDQAGDDIDYYNVLMLLLIETIITRAPISMLLQTSGETFFYNPKQRNEYGDHYKQFIQKPHLSLSLPYIFCQFLIENDVGLFDQKLPIITKNEHEVLRKIRSLRISNLSVHSPLNGITTIIHPDEDFDPKKAQKQFILSMFSNDFEKVIYRTTDDESVEFKTQAIVHLNTASALTLD